MASPTRPVNIVSPRSPPPGAGFGTPASRRVPDSRGSPAGTPYSGTPDLRSLRAQYIGTPPLPNIPPRTGASTPRPSTSSEPLVFAGGGPRPVPSIGGISARRPNAVGLGLDVDDVPPPDPTVEVDAPPEDDRVKVLRKHLVSREQRLGSNNGSSGVPSRQESTANVADHFQQDSAFPVPYHTPGADITHGIYKWQRDQTRTGRPRAVSFAGSTGVTPDPVFEHIHEPGGFRRNYVLLQGSAGEDGETPRILNNFIDFLYLFGHFAGEDLEEIEEEDEEMVYEDQRRYDQPSGSQDAFEPHMGLEAASGSLARILAESQPSKPTVSETSPLLPRSSSQQRSRIKRRRASISHGDVTVRQAVLMLLKGFVGTGVLFLGKAFLNGGILFSSLTLSAVAIVSLYAFLLLVRTRESVSGGYGEIGGILYGPWMRYVILTSITVSQIGFVSAYTIFVAENLQSFIFAASRCTYFIPVQYLIVMQLVVFLPLALIRNLAKLSITVLIADVFILVGLIYIFGSEFGIIAQRGIAKVELFNPKDFPLLIGTAAFSFEGIGLIIPIRDSMRAPHKFPMAISGVMAFLIILFGGAGAMSYLTFGSEVNTIILKNFDSASPFTQAVQLLYALAILLSAPLQLFPAVRIMENGLFTRSGKVDWSVKWQKNAFRSFVVMGCTALSWAGAKDLDKFVAFVGSFACGPLCYIYPPMLHYKACARTWKQKAADIALVVFGVIATAYTSAQTVYLMLQPAPPAAPIGSCDVRRF
ncbi:transmembrane amino acid transporter protein-domain-containing protein [Russula earlei]|uniref:Transmembrane amino acid transporter protein-domain-containing protein n=1 Tax=Russula earlei TaxID=71964 RepID=A0ACC0U1X1_9AGAM|nr:transmembrane amino acid transporter protein-domain-containing protein [Russula earlei]